MREIATPYNIPEQDSVYAGSYKELDFRPYGDAGQEVDLTKVPNIGFTMCLFGNYDSCALAFTCKDNVLSKPRIQINQEDKSHMTIYLYADDTEFFEDAYYDYQITFIGYEEKDNTVVGQGRIRVYSKINEK